MTENKKQNSTCDAEKQKEITEKLTECDNETQSDKDRAACYDEVVKKEKNDNSDACINS